MTSRAALLDVGAIGLAYNGGTSPIPASCMGKIYVLPADFLAWLKLEMIPSDQNSSLQFNKWLVMSQKTLSDKEYE